MGPDEILKYITDGPAGVGTKVVALSYFAKNAPVAMRADHRVKEAVQGLKGDIGSMDEISIPTVLVTCQRLNIPMLVPSLAKEAIKKVKSFKPQGITNTLNALAKFGHYDAAVVSRLAAEAKAQAGGFNPQDIANTLNALAKFDHYDAAVVSRLAAEAKAQAGGFNPQNIANTLGALAFFKCYTEGTFVLLYSLAVEMKFSTEGLTQLYLVHLAVSLEQPSWDLQLPAGLEQSSRAAFTASQASAESSRLHMQVSKTLDRAGVGHSNSVLVGGLSVDIRINCLLNTASANTGEESTSKVVVEVDGPSHFFREGSEGSMSNRASGSTLFKRRLLAAQGWKCVTVPYFEWGELKPGRKPQEDYLRHKLASC